MKLMSIFRSHDLKKSKKRDALKKVLARLKKKKHKLEEDLKSESSGKKRKKIESKLEANKRHRHKAERLIADLD